MRTSRCAVAVLVALVACGGSPPSQTTTPPENHLAIDARPALPTTHVRPVLQGFTTPCPSRVAILIDSKLRSAVDVACPPPLPQAAPGQPRVIVSDGVDVREAPGFDLPPGHHVIRVEFAGATAELAVEAPVYLDDAGRRANGVHGPLASWLLISISDLGIRIDGLSAQPMTM